MAIISALPYNLTNGTTADATQVMSDLNTIVTGVNANAAANGINTDITQIAGLSTPLSVSQGGTGSATASGARTSLGLGAAAVENLGGSIVDDGAGNLTIATNVNLPGSPTTTTQSGSDNSTKVATTAQVQSAITAASKITSVKVQVFASNGTYTPSAGMTYCVVKGVAKGGDGGSASNQAASGGGSGAYAEILYTALDIGVSKAVTVSSTTTSLGALFSCSAGSNGAPSSSGGSAGGVGGTFTYGSGSVLAAMNGQAGGYSFASTNNYSGGEGASSLMGIGGTKVWTSTGSQAGNSAVGYGAGGSGAVSNDGSSKSGGTGGSGRLVITEFCTQ